MTPLLSRELYLLLKEKLNLPPRVLSMSIDLKTNEPAIITVTSFVDRVEGDSLAEETKTFCLVAAEEVGVEVIPDEPESREPDQNGVKDVTTLESNYRQFAKA